MFADMSHVTCVWKSLWPLGRCVLGPDANVLGLVPPKHVVRRSLRDQDNLYDLECKM